MTTTNPHEVYRDPSFGDILSTRPPPQQMATPPGSAGQHFSSASEGYYNTPGPAAPETPVGPPISYRRVGVNADPGLHRSFSQRAKDRPFADEAFADDDDLDDGHAEDESEADSAVLNFEPIEPKSRTSVPMSQTVTRPGPEAAALMDRQADPDDLHHLQSPFKAQPTSTRMSQTSPAISPVTERTQRIPGPVVDTPGSSASRPAGNRGGNQRQAWASDRSPLQKLEVKLTDISKEEKRARVQEAELRLMREKGIDNVAAAKAPRDGRSASTQASSKGGTSREENKDRAKPSANTRSSRVHNTLNDTSSDAYLARKQAEIREVADAPLTKDLPSPNRAKPIVRKQLPAGVPARTTSKQQSSIDEAVSMPKPVPRIRSGRVASAPKGSKRMDIDERPISDQERDASHKATLDLLTGHGEEALKARRYSQKAKGAPSAATDPQPPVSPPERGQGNAAREHLDPPPQKTVTKGTEDHQPQMLPLGEQNVIGLGLQQPRALRSVDSPPVSLTDATKQRQRKSSVSFKEPFDRRRPIDEWKNAVTARLTREEFSTEQVEAPEMGKAWWEQERSNKSRRRSSNKGSNTASLPPQHIDDRKAHFNPRLCLRCGPLLRYAGLRKAKDEASAQAPVKEYWKGSIMIVTQDSQCDYSDVPTLRLFSQPKRLLPPPPHVVTEQLAPEYVDPIAGLTKLGRTGKALFVRPVDHLDEAKDLSRLEDDAGIYEASPSPLDGNAADDAPPTSTTTAASNKRTFNIDGERLGRYKEVKGARIYADPDRDVTFWRFNVEIELGSEQQHIAYRINKGAAMGFWVPAAGASMNIMFHSCNGFSLTVDPNQFSGPDPLWRNVLDNHQTRPFHVMIGGGDQIYNDRVMIDAPQFSDWTKIKSLQHKQQTAFTPAMKEELESFYLDRYCTWFSQGLFALATSSIPMINIWDAHDIIDGFGSYPDHFMRSPVFSGLGNIAFKYYMLFQHQSVDAMTEKDDPSWVLGHAPGPYIHARSRSVYMELGQSVAFLGVDCRTERTRDEVLSIDTLEDVLDRCRREMIEGQTKHLIVLLSVPIAYPRLVWLENVMTSRALGPLKALGRAGLANSKLWNKFDGGAELLDDLDDHWTATNHKHERNILIQELQDLAAEKSARVTILGGDVHLAAISQFYSNPKLKIAKDRDHRYMPNVISSAIVNAPPSDMVADVLNKRDKLHHLDRYTDENMIPMFTHDVDHSKRNNTRLLPRRNWCSIREYRPGDTPPPTPPLTPSVMDDEPSQLDDGEWYLHNPPKRLGSLTRQDFNPRNLMRRLSSRGKPPPNAFRNDGQGLLQRRSASVDDSVGRPQAHPYPNEPFARATSADHVPDVPALRPTFHRRPTNLSEKAAKKGNVPFIDEQGREHDLNDHVNLEGGLDISLHCEVDQRDPAGITTAYRLLVPALWYDGSSDREKLEDAVLVTRRETVLKKFGLAPRRSHKATDSQGSGYWGQDESDADSLGSGEHPEHEKPKRSFSFFGSMRKRDKGGMDVAAKEPPQITHPHDYDGLQESSSTAPAQSLPPQQLHQPPQAPQTSWLRASWLQSPSLKQSPPVPQQSYQQQHNDDRPNPARLVEVSPQGASTRHSGPSVSLPAKVVQQPPPNAERSIQPTNPASGTSSQPPQRDFSFNRGSNRSTAYTIGTSPGTQFQDSPTIGTTSARGSAPYDPDAAYVSGHSQTQAGTRSAVQPPAATLSHQAPLGSHAVHPYQSPLSPESTEHPLERSQIRRDRSLSKQEQVLGIGSSRDAYVPPRQTQLRGNGIIGKNYNPSPGAVASPPSAFLHSDGTGAGTGAGQARRSLDGQLSPAGNPPRGYDGIEAYREPSRRRRWSLSIRDKARSLRDSLEGRRRDDMYSDDDEEAFWEAPVLQQQHQHPHQNQHLPNHHHHHHHHHPQSPPQNQPQY